MERLVKILLFALIAFIFDGCSFQSVSEEDVQPKIIYLIDVTNYEDDLFHVTIKAKNLSEDNYIYNFVATAPGTYQVMDYGRFVTSFKAYDKTGREIRTKKLSINRWEIDSPEELSRIEYKIEDSNDAEIEDNRPAPMSGTGIHNDFIAFNTFGVLGYFEGLQSNPVKLKVDYKTDWIIGTAMDIDENGYYIAETYDRLADSPILIGDLTTARIKVNDIDVEMYLYTSDTAYTADKVLATAEDVLKAAGEFIGYSPVPYYKFLMVLLDNEKFSENNINGSGALEHSYSSLYYLPSPRNPGISIKEFMSHEFMHILTPLNLHSEIIHSYNFAVPTASEHIWLYEGVTEWSADIMQLRGGLFTIDEFLQDVSTSLRINDNFDQNISLSRMSLEVYDEVVRNQFFNFYKRGAVTAGLLDILLLELSNGERGLREVYLELLNKYGKYKPFPETEFFNIIVNMTYPEVEQFINDYIRDSNQLPIDEYMAKIGIKYIKEKPSDDKRPAFGFGNISVNENGKLFIRNAGQSGQFGIQSGDILVKLMGREVTRENISSIAENAYTRKVGEEYNVTVLRDDKEIEINGILLPRITKHAFEEMSNLTPEQKFLKKQWLRNL